MRTKENYVYLLNVGLTGAKNQSFNVNSMRLWEVNFTLEIKCFECKREGRRKNEISKNAASSKFATAKTRKCLNNVLAFFFLFLIDFGRKIHLYEDYTGTHNSQLDNRSLSLLVFYFYNFSSRVSLRHTIRPKYLDLKRHSEITKGLTSKLTRL